MRIDLEVLNSVDFIITTSTSDSECVSEAEEQMPNPKRRTTYDSETDRDMGHLAHAHATQALRGCSESSSLSES